MKEKVDCLIIGGSIAGCVTAILLSRLGIKVTILERSSAELKGQGTGITLPVPLVNKCIELDLFDSNIPRLPIETRAFFRKSSLTAQAEKIWEQPIKACTLNWMDVYRNLRKRLQGIDFFPSVNVTKIQKEPDGHYYLETACRKVFNADIVIAADGVESTIRNQCLPKSTEAYAGYIAWRGVLEETSFKLDHPLPYYVFPNGHLLFYRIPGEGYEQTGKTLLNWLMYEVTPVDMLAARLTDCKNIRHTRSIPPKALHEDQRQHLHDFANQQLPPMIAKIIRSTPYPFIQAIFDAQIPPYEDNQLIFMGDAATTLRPHSGSGAMKALSQAINLFEFISAHRDADIFMLLSQWKNLQQKSNAEEIEKAKIMGKALVTAPPSWQDMTQEKFDVWWSQVMKAQSWYATPQLSKSSARIFATTKPEDGKRVASILEAKL
ncbi:monooxygenase, FAD-binding (plasmid) [Legionella adelaidensis]|uniref:6-hydroxynicotinate 3-monooxygenase n=1 Tax=Legionella adelaidensis TaxID=45056 RepID=A0A0W0R2B3_9GAMM|nr:FAD-dependent monooxygenase [Legionella adelaidensis]KTC65189.1 6-hydroxynicotinate 3-monooxygenase precursor [Legionella adelaidensis]VEH86056.1 monooxygenase, FAD-binding [Legionella adelaidensis]